MEKEAYNRAVAFDTATINRQTVIIEELNERNDKYRERERELEDTVDTQRDEIKELREENEGLQLALEDREDTIRDLQSQQQEAREDSTQ